MISIQDLYSIFLAHPGISTDTRKILPGGLFFALKGGNFNGNKFAAEALEKGAAYCIIDESDYLVNESTILVNDVLTSLQDLARYHRQNINPQIIAITGSNGKTTTKELVYRVLSSQFETLATEGNLNNHIGVPLTLLRLKETHTHAIIEMGANHRYEIEQLCAIAEPGFGLITNIGKAHLEGFGGEMGVARGKTELYYHLFRNSGKAFINLNEENTVIYSQHLQCIYFPAKIEDPGSAKLISLSPEIEFELEGKNYKSALSGNYNFNNILSAISIGQYFGIEADKIGRAIVSYKPQNLRHQWVDWHSNKVLLDAYNANPDSMYHALKNFDTLDLTHKIVVLGDMFELGEDAKDEHQIIINAMAEYKFDEVLLCGELFSSAAPLNGVNVFKDFDALQAYFSTQNFTDKTILIKGSRGMGMERLIAIDNE